MVEKICPSKLQMIAYWLNIMKLGTRLKRHYTQFHTIPNHDEKYIKAKV